MLAALLTHTATVSRLTAASGNTKTYQQVSTGIACMIQPLDAVATQQVGLAYGKGYRGYFNQGTDVREGDQIVDQAGRKFFVKGIRLRNYGSFPHLDAVLGEDSRP